MAGRWYRDGLHFKCTGCGACCTGDPGYVWVTWDESKKLAKILRLSTQAFRERYLRRVGQQRYSLLERANGDCIFWENDRGCTVYSARPNQCRTFPFWPENLKSRATWEAVEAECPGAAEGGRFYPLDEIERIRRGESEASDD